MGYQTRFTLEITPEPEGKDYEKIWSYSIDGYDSLDGIFDSSSGDSYDCYKWYNHEDDMRALSKKFPKYRFTLHGEGEEAGDLWTKYFVKGKMQNAQAKIVIEEFDPKKLK